MMDTSRPRLIGEYIVGPRIGSGSFAVVWRGRHRQLGIEVAVKEIDKKLLRPKDSDNLLKEISILSTINHPNVIRFFEAIETKEKIYLVLEYCDGGDLAAYIHRHGKVSEAVARHFMRQLAAGLQVLQDKHFIHRDLKPQNLLLSTNEVTPVLKIGDFGFARSLTPQDLADTLCGSPLYMAPEIIQNQKYDAKADLWSVGAILFQLVTGKPPFDGSNQLQLFRNILTSTELRFPPGALEELHPDCVDLCRCLLCQNPVERITFKEFFNHKFLGELRQSADAQQGSVVPETKPTVEHVNSSTPEDRHFLHPAHPTNSSSKNPKSLCSLCDKVVLNTKDQGHTSSARGLHDFLSTIACDSTKNAVDGQCSSDQLKDLMESIEKEYVLVSSHFASMDAFSYYLDTSLKDNSSTKVSICPSNKNDHSAVTMQTEDLPSGSASVAEVDASAPLETSNRLSILKEVRGLTVLHPSTRLQLLNQYVHALTELAEEKYTAGLFLQSFSVELVVLAIWKKALQVCDLWLTSTSQSELLGTSLGYACTPVKGGTSSAPNSENAVDFSSPSSVCTWTEQGFIFAFDRVERLSDNIRDVDGTAEMPDAMEIIFQKALYLGKIGAVEEYIDNKVGASALYSKAMLLLSFIMGEAASVSLDPPFFLTPSNKKRIQSYIDNLQSHQSNFLMSQSSLNLSSDSASKLT